MKHTKELLDRIDGCLLELDEIKKDPKKRQEFENRIARYCKYTMMTTGEMADALFNPTYLKLLKEASKEKIKEQIVFLKNNALLSESEFGVTSISIYYTNLLKEAHKILREKCLKKQ